MVGSSTKHTSHPDLDRPVAAWNRNLAARAHSSRSRIDPLDRLVKRSIECLIMRDDASHRASRIAFTASSPASAKRLRVRIGSNSLNCWRRASAPSNRSLARLAYPLANASQHLLGLREAGLVESRKQGLLVYYRLYDDFVFELSRALRLVAERRLAELDRLVRDHFGDRSDPEPVGMDELDRRARSGKVSDPRHPPRRRIRRRPHRGRDLGACRRDEGTTGEAAERQGIHRLLPRTLLHLCRPCRRDPSRRRSQGASSSRRLPGVEGRRPADRGPRRRRNLTDLAASPVPGMSQEFHSPQSRFDTGWRGSPSSATVHQDVTRRPGM